MTDPRPILEEFANRANKYCINLNGKVTRDRLAFRGGFAAVYQGTLQETGFRVAIKTVQGGLPGDVKTIKRVLREAHVWSKLDHRNILPLIGLTTDFEISISLVSKWMATGNAYDYVQDENVDPRPLIVDIARGLCYLHNHPQGSIIHGDLKGVNVLISDEGHALISDFGLTQMIGSSFSMVASLPCGGSINWMAPEILSLPDEEDVPLMTVKSDVWAFGMTTLELFTREIPLSHLKLWIHVAQYILKAPPGRPGGDLCCHRMTDDWWAICSDCWARDPLLRPSMSCVLGRVEGTKGISNLILGLNVLSESATLLGINLDDRVYRDPDGTYGDGVIVSQGVLQPEGTKLQLKAIRTGLLAAANKGTVEKILRDMLLWSKTQHPNVLPMFGITTKFDHTVSIISKWTGTGNAHDYVQDKEVDPRSLLMEIANGLEYLHNHQDCPLIHGDLRGINVLVEEGRALLTFGVASLVDTLFEESATLYGCPRYWVAPEELALGGFPKTQQGDVWAFGMTALELFTREPPFHGTDICGFPARPSDEATCSRLTDTWWDICLLCWEREPLSRPTMPTIVKKINQTVYAPKHSSPSSALFRARLSMVEGADMVRNRNAHNQGPPSGGPYISKDVDGVMDQILKGCITAFCFILTKSDPKQSLSGSRYTTRCLYQGVDDSLPCHEQITYDDVPVHMKRIHGIGRISRHNRIECAWSGCALSVSRHNFLRHIREAHLGYERK